MEPLDFQGPISVETNVTQVGAQSAVGVRVDMRPAAAEGRLSAAWFQSPTLTQLAFTVPSLPATMPAVFSASFQGPRPGDGFIARVTLDVTVSPDGRSLASLGGLDLECVR
jgi:hypothetical protein